VMSAAFLASASQFRNQRRSWLKKMRKRQGVVIFQRTVAKFKKKKFLNAENCNFAWCRIFSRKFFSTGITTRNI